MTPEEQAEAILKAQEIVELDFQIFALDDLYADYHRQLAIPLAHLLAEQRT